MNVHASCHRNNGERGKWGCYWSMPGATFNKHLFKLPSNRSTYGLEQSLAIFLVGLSTHRQLRSQPSGRDCATRDGSNTLHNKIIAPAATDETPYRNRYKLRVAITPNSMNDEKRLMCSLCSQGATSPICGRFLMSWVRMKLEIGFNSLLLTTWEVRMATFVVRLRTQVYNKTIKYWYNCHTLRCNSSMIGVTWQRGAMLSLFAVGTGSPCSAVQIWPMKKHSYISGRYVFCN